MAAIITTFSYLSIFGFLAALAWRDLKEYILPNKLNAALAVSFMVFHMTTHWKFVGPVQAAAGCLMGGGMLLAIRAVANRYYNADSLGLGDVKLMAAAGLGLGIPDIFMALSLGAFVALLHGLVMAGIERKNNHKVILSQINVPAGLGLAIGIAIMTAYRFGSNPFRFLHG